MNLLGEREEADSFDQLFGFLDGDLARGLKLPCELFLINRKLSNNFF